VDMQWIWLVIMIMRIWSFLYGKSVVSIIFELNAHLTRIELEAF
jgi:hypothetical protein